MSSNIDPAAAAPPDQQAPAPVEQQPAAPEGPPRDDAGRFTAPQPPVIEQPAIPQPPAAPRVDADRAVEFYERLADPRTRSEEFIKVGREYGFVPDGLTPDQVQEALLLYQDYQQQLTGQPQQPVGMPPVPGAPLPGVQPDGGWQPQAPMPAFDPDQLAQQVEQRVMSAWEQREQQAQVKRAQEERLGNLQAAVAAVAKASNLDDAKHRILLQNVALGVDTAVSEGRPVDFSVEKLEEYGRQIADMFGWRAVEQQAQTQEAIAQHRAIAPQTTVPTGAPQAGAPGGPRGIRGVVDRIRADQAARAAGG
jgi:hypothetical protein